MASWWNGRHGRLKHDFLRVDSRRGYQFMAKKRKKLWGVWLSNHVDHRDDEWAGVMATTADEAKKSVVFNERRFSIRDVAPAKEFCRKWGIQRNWLRVP